MPHFNTIPNSGIGITNVTVSPNQENLDYEPIESTLRVSNGSITRNVALIQHGLPCLRDRNTLLLAETEVNIDNNTTTLSYVIDSDFPVSFDMPGYMTVYLCNDEETSEIRIQPDQIIPISDIKKTGNYIDVHLTRNTSSSARNGTLEMSHYVNNTASEHRYDVKIIQNDPSKITVPWTIRFDSSIHETGDTLNPIVSISLIDTTDPTQETLIDTKYINIPSGTMEITGTTEFSVPGPFEYDFVRIEVEVEHYAHMRTLTAYGGNTDNDMICKMEWSGNSFYYYTDGSQTRLPSADFDGYWRHVGGVSVYDYSANSDNVAWNSTCGPLRYNELFEVDTQHTYTTEQLTIDWVIWHGVGSETYWAPRKW